MNNKFELTSETKVVFGKTLYRIRALVDFGVIKKGELGGFVEKEDNLSTYGNAWVYGDAKVFGDALVYGNALVSSSAWVYGNALVSSSALVYGDARVYGNAEVSGSAWVYGNALVCGNAKVCGDAEVSGNALVCGNAKVCGDAEVSGNAEVSGSAEVSGNALVCGDADLYNLKTDLWNVTITRQNIAIGCQMHSADDWFSFNDDKISSMHPKALAWWKDWKPIIVSTYRLIGRKNDE